METRKLLPDLWEIILSHRFGHALIEARTVDKAFDGYTLRVLFKQTDDHSVRLQAKILSDPARVPTLAHIPDGAILRAMLHPNFDFADRINALTAIAKRKNLEWVLEDKFVDDVLHKIEIIFGSESKSIAKLLRALSPTFNHTQRDKLLKNRFFTKEIYEAFLPHLNAQLDAALKDDLEFLNHYDKDSEAQDKILRELISFAPYFNTSQQKTMYDAVIKLFKNKFDGVVYKNFTAALNALSALAPYLNDQQAQETIELAKARLSDLSYPIKVEALRLLISLWSHLDDVLKAYVTKMLLGNMTALSDSYLKRDVFQLNLIIWFRLDAEQRAIFFNNFLDELKYIFRVHTYFVTKALLFLWPDLTNVQHKKALETLLNHLDTRTYESNDSVLEVLSALWYQLKDDEKQQVLMFVKDKFDSIYLPRQRQALESLPKLADNLNTKQYEEIAVKILRDQNRTNTTYISEFVKNSASIKAFSTIWRHFTDETRQIIFTQAQYTHNGLRFLLMLLVDKKYHVEASTFLQTTYDSDSGFTKFRCVLPILPLLWSQLSEHWRSQMLVMLQSLLEQPELYYTQPYEILITLWPNLITDQRVPFIELAKKDLKDTHWWLASCALNLLSYEAVSTKHPAHLQSDEESLGTFLLNQLITWHSAAQEALAHEQHAGSKFYHFQPASAELTTHNGAAPPPSRFNIAYQPKT